LLRPSFRPGEHGERGLESIATIFKVELRPDRLLTLNMDSGFTLPLPGLTA